MQKKRLLGQLAVLFGGRVAEQEFCGDISAGASDDIKRATDLARAMVTELGMSARIGPINYAERQGSDFLGTELMRGKQHSEDTAREIDKEIRAILDEAYARAESLIREHRSPIEEIMRALLLYENISGEEIARILKGERHSDLRRAEREAAASHDPRPTPAPGKGAEKSADGDLSGDFNPGLSPA
jgi:cell division protease FtsH